ncbi:MAG: DNA polymerase I [Aggregatilineales bacterium]
MADARPILYLIDGHAVAYRQFYALNGAGFTTSSGEPTNAVFGFTRGLLDILQNERPKYLAVSFDRGLSGREDLYADYKGTRDKMPDDLQIQMIRIEQIVRAFNIPILAVEGYEADDVIGTVAKQAEAEGVHIHIITGDRDILQLLTPNVRVQLPKRGESDQVFDIAAFEEKYNIRPDQLVDMKALMGDSSDNIPGVKGIGEKGAAKLLTDYETLDGIYSHIEDIKGATRTKLENDHEMAYISQNLAQIQRNVPIEITLAACEAHDFDVNVVAELFREMEFRSLLSRLLSEFGGDEPITVQEAESDDDGEVYNYEVETVIVRDEAGLKALVEVLNKAKAITWDVETTSIDQMAGDLVGISLSVDGKIGYYVPVGHKPEGDGTMFSGDPVEQLPMQMVIDALRPPLTNPKIPKYAHNAAYDLVVLQRYGIDVSPIKFDTMIAEWLRDPISKYLGLKAFAQQYLEYSMTEIKELIGTGKKQITMAEVTVEDAAPYAAADAAITHRAVSYLRPYLKNDDLMELLDTLEMPLVPVIASMERAGVALDVPFLRDLSETLDGQIKALEGEIFGLSGGYGDFNINSPKQLNDVLFGKLGLSTGGLRKTSHGYSTDVVTLEALKDEHEIIAHILDYRELTKLKSTYVDALPELINPQTGRVHTSYNQTGTSTGRLSSSNPNLQNIPIRTEIGREVRRAFTAPEGRVLLAVDYSQIELRVMAHISGDPTLLQAFADGLDIHAATAAAVNNVSLDEVTYEMRSFAKRVNFGLMYGMGAFRLSRDSELTLAEAEAFVKTYFERFPQVKVYMDNTEEKAKAGMLTTLVGRKRNFAALQNVNGSRRAQQAELRAAINMPIQGTAADIMKRAMIDLYDALNAHKSDSCMILQVHDELVLEVPEDDAQDITKLVVDVMENAYQLDAPLKANAQIGKNWRDMETVQ